MICLSRRAMADFDKYAPLLRQFEGGFVNDPCDPGGATNKGVTLAVFRQFFGQDKTVADLKAITDSQWRTVMKSYWDRVKGDKINSQPVAEMLADWHINAGTAAIRSAQRALNLEVDGIIGPNSLSMLNQPGVFPILKDARIQYYKTLVLRNRSLSKFLNGWINRVNMIKQ